ncbi:MAG: hypothetical protein AB7N76_09565 [Planctomycetota bacterium]
MTVLVQGLEARRRLEARGGAFDYRDVIAEQRKMDKERHEQRMAALRQDGDRLRADVARLEAEVAAGPARIAAAEARVKARDEARATQPSAESRAVQLEAIRRRLGLGGASAAPSRPAAPAQAPQRQEVAPLGFGEVRQATPEEVAAARAAFIASFPNRNRAS